MNKETAQELLNNSNWEDLTLMDKLEVLFTRYLFLKRKTERGNKDKDGI